MWRSSDRHVRASENVYHASWWLRLLTGLAALLAAPAVPLWIDARPVLPKEPGYVDYLFQTIFLILTAGMVGLIAVLLFFAFWPNQTNPHPEVEG